MAYSHHCVKKILRKNPRYQNQKRFQIPLQKFYTGWLAARIRRRKPKLGSIREKQAALYEAIAAALEARMETTDSETQAEK